MNMQHKERNYLLIWTGFCIALLTARMIYTESFEFRFMAFNLLLGWIPYWAAIATQKLRKSRLRLFVPVSAFIWLIFLPNAPYMITDIFHLHKYPSMPMWFDLIMLLSFAFTGLLLGFLSLLKIIQVFRKYPVMAKPISIFLLFTVCGAGIYLGRYQRWNSWEIITQPQTLVSEMIQILQQPNLLAQMCLLSVLFAAFFTLLYLAFYRPAEGAQK